MPSPNRRPAGTGSLPEIFGASLRLGLTSFGGPVAHLGYFRDEYVLRRKWLDEKSYADLVALCQFLPGPASSQVGIGIGMMRGGVLGGIVSWLGFTIPSALVLALFAIFLQGSDLSGAGWLRGLLVAAVAVVAQAVWGMAAKLAPDRERMTIALLTALAVLLVATAAAQIILIAAAGLVGWMLLPKTAVSSGEPIGIRISRRLAIGCWVLFFGLLAGLPIARQLYPVEWLAVTDSFYRVGSLVFGGGHVVLPLLQTEVVPTGWVTTEQFIAGYGAAQAVPGPLFTFSAYLGATLNGWIGAVVAIVAVFFPSLLLVAGTLPFWNVIRQHSGFQSALGGINAAVVGILLAALYDPVWIKAIRGPYDFSLAVVAFGLLVYWKTPSWLVVIICALGGALIGTFT
ncbi:MAG: chromate efflux transporter [Firmicutes bacterium]|nr:chromate efflux transporter [Bacillota bacterium]